MAPGPLLTYTIIQAAQEKRSGYLVGVFVIIGHALVEMILILFMLLGFSYIVENQAVIKGIGVIGGGVLVLFGVTLVKDLIKGNISTEFLNAPRDMDNGCIPLKNKGASHTILGGAMVSMSNPYWWIWWATIGLAFMTQINVSLKNWPHLAVFFIGHEAGDLAWYLLISMLAFWGIRYLNKKVYYGILGICGAFMIFFGIYLGMSPLFFLS